MRPPLSRIPLLPATIGLVVGIIFAYECQSYAVAAMVVALVIALILIWRKEWWWAFMAFCAIPGLVTMYLQPLPLDHPVEGEWIGQVETVEDRESALVMKVNIDRQVIDSSAHKVMPICVKLIVPSPEVIILSGDIVRFHGRLMPMTDETDLPYEVSDHRRYRSQGLSATSLVSPEELKLMPESTFIKRMSICRQWVSDRILRSRLSTSSKEFLVAALLGDRSILDTDVYQSYSVAGVAHVLAISGLHVGIIAWLITLMLWPWRYGPMRYASSVIAIAVLWGYAFITALSPSVTRSVIMLTIILCGNMLNRRGNAFNSLLCAAILILCVSPLTLFNIGFQMSVTAVGAILMFSDHLNPVSPRNRAGYFIMSIVSSSLAAVAGTALITAFYFHRFPLTFIFSNLIVSLLLPLMMVGGIMLIIVSAIGLPDLWLCRGIDILNSIQHTSVEWFAGLPGGLIDDIYLPWWPAVAWIAVLIIIKLWIVRRRRAYGIMTALAICCFITLMFIPEKMEADCRPRVYFKRGTTATEAVVVNGNEVTLMSTTPRHNHERVRQEFVTHNHEWLTRIKADSVTIMSPRHMVAGDMSMVMIYKGRKVRSMHRKVSHAVICRGFSGKLKSICDSVDVDTIILSADLSPRVYKRMVTEAEELSLNIISLKDGPHSIAIKAPTDCSR